MIWGLARDKRHTEGAGWWEEVETTRERHSKRGVREKYPTSAFLNVCENSRRWRWGREKDWEVTINSEKNMVVRREAGGRGGGVSLPGWDTWEKGNI